MMLYTDARDLQCGHSFCLSCLLSNDEKKCPKCELETIPNTEAKINDLTINVGKNGLVASEMARRVKKSHWMQLHCAESMKDGVRQIHEGVTCSNCEKKDFAGIRYTCGVCPGYNLCEECEDEPKSHKHDKTHIFVKLKRPATKPLPQGPILTEAGMKMGRVIESESNDHRTHRLQLGPLVAEVSFAVTARCDKCPKEKGRIKGTRFHCGHCADFDLCTDCERRSDIIHDPCHVFMKMRQSETEMIEGAYDGPLLLCEFFD